jgi:hypothetical protein
MGPAPPDGPADSDHSSHRTKAAIAAIATTMLPINRPQQTHRPPPPANIARNCRCTAIIC